MPRGRGAFFGRRKGKALRLEQTAAIAGVLPRLRLDLDAARKDPASLFPRRPSELQLEIGFGGGEHLVTRAMQRPDAAFIGCEPFVNGMAKLLTRVDREGLGNIRVHDADAVDCLAALPDASLSAIHLLYPDPWPKRRHHKRRFVSDETVAAFARLLRPGGTFRFASDIDDYVGWTLVRVLRSEAFRWAPENHLDWTRPWDGWPGTRYEAKALREGRVPTYLTFERR